MDSTLVEELEQRLAGLQDCDYVELNPFEDGDFAMYPAIEIPEITDLTADQSESIANYLISCIATGESGLIAEAARAMPVLAYNSLMASDGETLFFHKFSKRDFTEDWLRTTGVSQVDLQRLASENLGAENGSLIRLVDPNASELQRKTSIGVWAFCHLRALWQSYSWTLCKFFNRSEWDTGILRQIYTAMETCAYKFPMPDREHYGLFLDQCMLDPPGELLYAFYRGAIILEKISHDSHYRRECVILQSYVYCGEGGLQFAGLSILDQLEAASAALNITAMQLLNDLEWALNDDRWKRYSPHSLKTVDILRQFYRRYDDRYRRETGGSRRSRYFMYAHPVNHHYFYFLSNKCNKELAFALERISGSMQTRNSPYAKWAVLIAERILEKYRNPRVRARW